MSEPKLIQVTGDCVCDHNFYKGKRPKADSEEKRGFRPEETCGGAFLLTEIIASTLKASPEVAGVPWQASFWGGKEFKGLTSQYHAFSFWEPQNSVINDKKVEVWRASEPPLGYGQKDRDKENKGQTDQEMEVPEARGFSCGKICGPFQAVEATPEIVVIDDAGLGFRNLSESNRWPEFLVKGGTRDPRWVVLKLTGKIGEGDLWKKITSRCPDNLILVVSANQLRSAEVRIGKGLSWEATAEDLAAELQNNPALDALRKARHLIVTFQSDGAFWLDNGPEEEGRSSLLVFDAARAEGEWAANQGPGTVFGFMSCLVAAVVGQLCLTGNDETPDFEKALAAGLSASRELRRRGHGPVMVEDPQNPKQMVDNPKPGFPFREIASTIWKPGDVFVSSPVPDQAGKRGKWMMLEEWYAQARDQNRQRPFFDVAQAVAMLGSKALGWFPVAEFGGLKTVDRKEIESLRTIRRLMEDYEKGRPQNKPLNIGVFGPPGAGKSFGVKQIATAVLGPKVAFKTFNLSQFEDPAEIAGALHQVRDLALSGKTPVIFWDEFDAKGYQWLQYLLAPMQDGEFQDGPITHPIGMCVFIFAGATSPTAQAFGPLNPEDVQGFADLLPEEKSVLEANWRQFVLNKGPDFKSRLAGFLNVLGPNPRQECEVIDGRRKWTNAPDDYCCPIRRALFMRVQFKLKDGDYLALDKGVLRAMLEVSRYKSGARSLEFLCQGLRKSASGKPSRSDLPGDQLLDMHVDAKEFWAICERDLPAQRLGPALQAALHEEYRLGIKGDPEKKDRDVPFDQLDPGFQKANWAQALRIPENLRLLDLGLEKIAQGAPADEGEVPLGELLAIKDNQELLAEAEHNGWMVERLSEGWTYSRTRDNKKKKHNNLVPFSRLSEMVKDYDRHAICGFVPPEDRPEDLRQGYVGLLRKAGYRVVRLGE